MAILFIFLIGLITIVTFYRIRDYAKEVQNTICLYAIIIIILLTIIYFLI